jgi:hypothetical protein
MELLKIKKKFEQGAESTKPSNKKQIGIKVGHDRVNSAVDVKGTLHKK